jgi:hypothetical protein
LNGEATELKTNAIINPPEEEGGKTAQKIKPEIVLEEEGRSASQDRVTTQTRAVDLEQRSAHRTGKLH